MELEEDPSPGRTRKKGGGRRDVAATDVDVERSFLKIIAQFTAGDRILDQRKQSPKPAPWSTDSFRKLFPGAQWLGDGSTVKVHGIPVTWGEETFSFNLEIILDVDSNALVGMRGDRDRG